MSFNAFGKPAETVDFGAEVDYASYEWFKDPPPRSEVFPFFYTLATVLLTLSGRSTPPSLNPTIKARHIHPSRASSKRIRCVTLPSRPRLTCCSDATNSTDRCVAIMPLQLQFLIFFKSPSLAGRARVVRRV